MDKKQLGWLLIGGFLVFLVSVLSFSFGGEEKQENNKGEVTASSEDSKEITVEDSLRSVLEVKDSIISSLRVQLAYASNTGKKVDTKANGLEANTKTYANGIQIRTTQVESFDDFTNITLEFFSTKDVQLFIKRENVYVNVDGNVTKAKSFTGSEGRFNVPANTRQKMTFHCLLNENVDFIEYFYCGFSATWPEEPYKSYYYVYDARSLNI